MAKSTKSSSRKAPAKKSTSSAKKSAKSSSRRKSPAKKAATKMASMSGKEHLMELFEHALKDMLWVEKSLTKAIPKMIRKAGTEQLQKLLFDHLKVTDKQVSRLERVFNGIDKPARGKKCVGMEGIMKEGEELMKEFEGAALDAAIIAAAQKVEHYEIASYTSMITLARTLDHVKEADILQEILDEEIDADRLLTNLSIRSAHEVAMEP